MTLEERLARLEGERDILRLSALYCHGADDRDVAEFLGVWAVDAVWDVGPHRFEGLPAIEEAVRRQWTAVESMIHATTNSRIDWEDDATASGRHDVISVATLTGGAHLLTTGRYDDLYVRSAAGWRIRERRARVTTSLSLAPHE